MHSIFITAKDAKLLESLKQLFIRAGYKVSTFSHSGTMLRELKEHVPQCILAEAHNSISATKKLLKDVRGKLPDAPVIVVESNGEISHAMEALRAGATDYIQTPIVDRILVEAVHAAISNLKL
ncbi:MAG: response regulator [Pseudomonadales bacterium]|nr:response regulator [Pseudomonadales bacterium]